MSIEKNAKLECQDVEDIRCNMELDSISEATTTEINNGEKPILSVRNLKKCFGDK